MCNVCVYVWRACVLWGRWCTHIADDSSCSVGHMLSEACNLLGSVWVEDSLQPRSCALNCSSVSSCVRLILCFCECVCLHWCVFPDSHCRHASAFHFLSAGIGLHAKSAQLFMLLGSEFWLLLCHIPLLLSLWNSCFVPFEGHWKCYCSLWASVNLGEVSWEFNSGRS